MLFSRMKSIEKLVFPGMKFAIFCLLIISTFLATATHAQTTDSACSASEIYRTNKNLKFVDPSLASKISKCPDDQTAQLRLLGFTNSVNNTSLRLFLLKELIENKSRLAKGIYALVKLNTEAAKRTLFEISQLQYGDVELGSAVRIVNSPIKLLGNVGLSGSCHHQDFACALTKHVNFALDEIRNEQKRLWKSVSAFDENIMGALEAQSFAAIEAAYLIELYRPSLDIFTSTDSAKIRRLSVTYQKTTSQMYSGDNRRLRELSVFTLGNCLYQGSCIVDRPLDDFILNDFAKSNGFHPNDWFGGRDFSNITGHTSKSPLRSLYGVNARREVFWPWHRINEPQTDLNSTRVSVIYDENNEPKLIEVIARDYLSADAESKNDGWLPFVYEKKWGRWLPVTEINNVPVKKFCISCHSTSDNRFSPYPSNLKTAEDFLDVGYLDKKQIELFLEFRE